MKKVFLILSLLYCLGLGAQTIPSSRPRTFEVITQGAVQNISGYINALEHTFLDRYRALNHRTIMQFEEGVAVQLYSANELQEMGLPVNLSVINTVPANKLKFTLHSSGRIVKWTPPQTTTPR